MQLTPLPQVSRPEVGTEPGWAEAVQESKKHIAPGFYLELIVIVVVYVLHFFLCSVFSLLWEKETVFNSLGVLLFVL